MINFILSLSLYFFQYRTIEDAILNMRCVCFRLGEVWILNLIYYSTSNITSNPGECQAGFCSLSNSLKSMCTATYSSCQIYNELNGYKDEHLLTITHLYNSTAISNCFWNGCDTCKLNPVFLTVTSTNIYLLRISATHS